MALHIEDKMCTMLNQKPGETLEQTMIRLTEATPGEKVVPGTFRTASMQDSNGWFYEACIVECSCAEDRV